MFVSAALGSASCRGVIAAITEGRVTPVVSPRLLTDLRRVLTRPKFRHIATTAAADELIQLIEGHGMLITPRHQLHVSRDPDDNHLFSLAIEGGASAIVSGDADVLSALPIAGLRVVSPRQFLAWLARR